MKTGKNTRQAPLVQTGEFQPMVNISHREGSKTLGRAAQMSDPQGKTQTLDDLTMAVEGG